jgi:hypothetical protein
MACRTCPQSGWPPTSARVRPPDTRLDTVSADQSPLRTPGSRWPGGGHGGPLDRPVGRTSPVRGDRPADGSGPGPDSGGQAADTSSAQRPTMPLASRPRPTTRPARPGPLSRQDGNAHARLRPIPAATSIGTARRDHLRPCSMPERPQAWSPSDVRAVVSGVHDGRHDRTAFGHRRPVDPAGHRPLHPARHGEPEATRTGNGRTARKAFGHPRSPRPQGGPPGHAGSAMATPPARPQPRQRPGGCLVSLYRPSGASARCCPRMNRG